MQQLSNHVYKNLQGMPNISEGERDGEREKDGERRQERAGRRPEVNRTLASDAKAEVVPGQQQVLFFLPDARRS